jgi:hypothetical protein
MIKAESVTNVTVTSPPTITEYIPQKLAVYGVYSEIVMEYYRRRRIKRGDFSIDVAPIRTFLEDLWGGKII